MLKRFLASAITLAVLASASPLAKADGLIVISNPPPTTIVRGHFSFAPL